MHILMRSPRAMLVVPLVLSSGAAIAQVQTTSRESVSTAGDQGNFHSNYPTISADGRFVAFDSSATNIVGGDTNFRPDAFVRDRLTGQTTRVSVSSAGVQGTGNAELPSISANGRFVAFMSDSTEFAAGGTPGYFSIFVHDRLTGQTTRVSESTLGVPGNSSSRQPSISADGNAVVFESAASNLVPGDTNGFQDVFVHDRTTGETTRVSAATDGTQGNDNSGGDSLSRPRLSADGRFVAFQSHASNLVADDTSSASDIFVHDRLTGETTRASVTSSGGQASGDSLNPSISADGRYVAFLSTATNFVPVDANGFTPDIFVRDRLKGTTKLVSVSSRGVQGNGMSSYPAISADGTLVAFWGLSTNLVPAPLSGAVANVFVHNRETGVTTLASAATDGALGDSDSREPEFSADGRFVAFHSLASTLVPGDTNGFFDVFVRDLGAPAGIPGDVNGDGAVNAADLATLLGAWGPCPAPCVADINGDGAVNAADLALLLGSWTG